MDLVSIKFLLDSIGPFLRNGAPRAKVCLIIVLRVAYAASVQAPSEMHYFDRSFPHEGVVVEKFRGQIRKGGP